MTAEDIQDNHAFMLSNKKSGEPYDANRIKVIGVGGGGNNAINHMYNMGVKTVKFIIANTDRQALDNSPVPTKVLLGPNTLKGRGAGNMPERAREAAEESAEQIQQLFEDETDMVFITAGMGGGTGTGASPVIARISREKGILTIGIVTIPFLFEGRKKILKALEGAKEMSKYVDALLVINNERLSEIYHDFDFLSAFGKADDILSMAAMSISEIITSDGYINLDFNDVNTTLREGRTAIIATGYGEGPDRVTKAIQDALNSPLLRNKDIFGSSRILFNLYFSREADDKFKIDETNQITSFISNIHSDVDVIWGVAFDESLGNKVKFTILAAGFDVSVSESGSDTLKVQELAPNLPKEDPQPTTIDLEAQTQLNDVYGSEKMAELEKAQNEHRYIILQPEDFDNEKMFEVLEQNPTYNRDKTKANREKEAAKSTAPSPASPAPSQGKSIDFSEMM